MSRPIDVMHLGRDRVICAFEHDGLIVDPGPATCVDALLEALGPVEPRVLLLTHIHLDHAGATGVLCRRFPALRVYVHERGAPHLVDPGKLLRSASRLYGDDMEPLWGEVAPVERSRVTALSGGETVEGHRVAYTPGHASHHVSYLREDSGEAFVGDVAGVRVPPHDFTLPPTPPPDIDLEAWEKSLQVLEGWAPESLCLTHFGPYTDVSEQIARVREGLGRQAAMARDLDEDGFVGEMRKRLSAEIGAEAALSFEQAAPPEQLYQGLDRYWTKRGEADAA
ncbi:MAG: MBL fold metallo-hydrolase [Thermoleophilaceae bacterium]|nr:MBL fold metallo-hydrolase [Thermoleophilaceae bacterium]